MTPAANLPPVVDIGGNLPPVVDTGDKFAAGVVDTAGGKLSAIGKKRQKRIGVFGKIHFMTKL